MALVAWAPTLHSVKLLLVDAVPRAICCALAATCLLLGASPAKGAALAAAATAAAAILFWRAAVLSQELHRSHPVAELPRAELAALLLDAAGATAAALAAAWGLWAAVPLRRSPAGGYSTTAAGLLYEPLLGDDESPATQETARETGLPACGSGEEASWLSWLTLSYLTPLFVLGRRRQLQQADLPPLAAADSTELWAARFWAALEAERISASLNPYPDGNPNGYPERKPKSTAMAAVAGNGKRVAEASLVRVAHRVWGSEYYRLGLLKLATTALGFSGPLLLERLVASIDGSEGASARSFWLATALVVCYGLSALLGGRYSLGVARVQLHARGGLATAVCRRALALPLWRATALGLGPGALSNAVSTDVSRVADCAGALHDMWSLPLQLAVTFYLLHTEVAFAFAAGAVVIAVMVPLNAALARRIGRYSRGYMAAKDERMGLCAELIRHARAARMLGVGDWLAARLAEARGREIANLAAQKYLDAACVYFWATTPVLVSLATFAVAAAAAPPGAPPPSPAKVFAAVALLNGLIFPMNALPWIVNGVVEAAVSLRRLRPLLLAASEPEDEEVEEIRVETPLELPDASGVSAAGDGGSGGGSSGNGEGGLAAGIGAGGDAINTGSNTGGGGNGGNDGRRDLLLSLSNTSFSWSQQPLGPEDATILDEEYEQEGEEGEVSAGIGLITASTNLRAATPSPRRHPMPSSPRRPLPMPRQLSVRQTIERQISVRQNWTLRDVTLRAHRGDLVCVVGKVGSGKTTLLHGLLWELLADAAGDGPDASGGGGGGGVQRQQSGSVVRRGLRVAYAAQTPWLQSTSVRQNILFGRSFCKDRYALVVEACGLAPDFAALAAANSAGGRGGGSGGGRAGDSVSVGGGGATLSGGQRRRVALARCAYGAADIYVLDDPFAGLDAETQALVAQRCVLGLMCGGGVNGGSGSSSSGETGSSSGSGRGGGAGGGSGSNGASAGSGRDHDKEKNIAGSVGGLNAVKKPAALASVVVVATRSQQVLAGATTVLLLDGGGVAEAGTYEQLLASPSGRLRELLATETESESGDPPLAHTAAGAAGNGATAASAAAAAAPAAAAAAAAAGAASAGAGAVAGAVADTAAAAVPAGAVVGAATAGNGASSAGDLDIGTSEGAGLSSTPPVAATAAAAAAADEMALPLPLRELPHSAITAVAAAAADAAIVPKAAALASIPPAAAAATPNAGGDDDGAAEDLEEREKREEGAVALAVHARYLQAAGVGTCAATIASLLIMQGSANFFSFWLSRWAASDGDGSGGGSSSMSRRRFLTVISAVAAVNALAALGRSLLFARGGIMAARVLHDRLMGSLMGVSASYYDSVPLGRVLNRCGGDVFTVDDPLPFHLNILLAQAAGLAGTAVVLAVASPALLLLLPAAAVLYVRLARLYRPTSREQRRIDSVARSPVLALLTEAFEGSVTVRAFGQAGTLSRQLEALLAESQRASFCGSAASAWLALRLQALGVAVVAFVAFAAVLSSLRDNGGGDGGGGGGGGSRASMAGLALSYALPIVGGLTGLLGAFTETEREMIAVERIEEYADLPPEERANWTNGSAAEENRSARGNGSARRGDATAAAAAAAAAGNEEEPELSQAQRPLLGSAAPMSSATPPRSGKRNQTTAVPPPRGWPASGAIEYSHLMVRYKPHRPPAVAGVSLRIAAGEKVALIGRTGAGKSSLVLALFRLAPVCGGGVSIDGVDVSGVPLALLRRRLAAVPQEPVLFRGTVRENLDPFGEAGDVAIWAALEDCCMAKPLREMAARAAEMAAAAAAAAGAASGAVAAASSPAGSSSGALDLMVGDGSGGGGGGTDGGSGGGSRVSEFSLGQRQLLCLARALIRRAAVVVVDEPAAALDGGTAAVVATAVRRRLARQTVLMVTHRLATATEVCSRVVVMDGGHVVEDGAPRVLLAIPGSRFSRLKKELD